jgi:hypothetical protein
MPMPARPARRRPGPGRRPRCGYRRAARQRWPGTGPERGNSRPESRRARSRTVCRVLGCGATASTDTAAPPATPTASTAKAANTRVSTRRRPVPRRAAAGSVAQALLHAVAAERPALPGPAGSAGRPGSRRPRRTPTPRRPARTLHAGQRGDYRRLRTRRRTRRRRRARTAALAGALSGRPRTEHGLRTTLAPSYSASSPGRRQQPPQPRPLQRTTPGFSHRVAL